MMQLEKPLQELGEEVAHRALSEVLKIMEKANEKLDLSVLSR